MTGWKMTIRTAPGALIAAEYECPVHGRFAVDVPREANGDPPDETACPARPSKVALVDQTTGALRWIWNDEPCGAQSPYVISAPGTAKVRKVEAIRGSYQKPEFETWTNTENLGEGQDLDDWRDDRAKVWEREREREAMELAREI